MKKRKHSSSGTTGTGNTGHLLLERKLGQSINIGGAIVKVVKIGKEKVMLAIEADRSVRIVRTELEQREKDHAVQ